MNSDGKLFCNGEVEEKRFLHILFTPFPLTVDIMVINCPSK